MRTNRLVLVATALIGAAGFCSAYPLTGETLSPANPTTADSIAARITGEFPEGCYPTPTSTVTITGNNIAIDLVSIRPSGGCTQIVTPFTVSVTIGKLAAGAYTVTYRLFFGTTLMDTATQSLSVASLTVSVTIATSPSGLQITVDGATLTAPQSLLWIPGSSHSIGVVSPQGGPVTRQLFTSWSDGGTATHMVTASAAATAAATNTATFKTQYLFSASVSPSNAGTVTASPASADGFYDSGTRLQVSAKAASGNQFQEWGGDLAGSANPATVMMKAPHGVIASFVPAASQTLAITTASLSDGLAGVVYPAVALDVQGGTAPYLWSASGLPAGMDLSTGGVLSGTPAGNATGSFQISVTVQDSSTPKMLTATRTYSIAVSTAATLLNVAPAELDFDYVQGDPAPDDQQISAFSNPPGSFVTVQAVTTDGANWLSTSTGLAVAAPAKTPVPTAVTVTPAGLAPGTYSGQVTIGASNTQPSSVTVEIRLTVRAATPPQLSVTPARHSFALAQGGHPVMGQVTVSNTGGGTLQFSAQVSANANWLVLDGGGSGTATESSPGTVSYSVNPSGLGVGQHAAVITVTDANSGVVQTSRVVLVVNAALGTMRLSQVGLTFLAVAGGPAPSPQSFSVFNLGQGTMPWSLQTRTNPAGQTWLQVNSTTGSSSPGTPGRVTVSVDPTGLAAGRYHALVNVMSPNAVNTPQGVAVVLRVVLPGRLFSAPDVSPAGIILAGVAGASAPVQQDVALFDPGANGLSFSAVAVAFGGATWLSVSPASGSLSSSGAGKVTVQGSLAGVSKGVHNGVVKVAFSNGTVRTIQVSLLVAAGTAGAALTARADSTVVPAAGCQPTRLVTVFQGPQEQQAVQVAQAQSVRVQLLDDCNNPVLGSSGGAAQVTFSNLDDALNLADTGGGIWEATWSPVTAQPSVTVLVVASAPGAGLNDLLGGASIKVKVLPADADAAAQALGALNAASFDVQNAGLVAAGSYVSIYGARLASSTAQAQTVPLPPTLGSTQLLVGGVPLPLSFASPGQVNGIIPQGLAPNTELQLYVQRDNTDSIPVPLTVTDLQPGIFTIAQNGQGQGAILIANTATIAGPAGPGSQPVPRGGYVEIYCTGLGPAQGPGGTPPPADGVPAPANGIPLYNTVATATVTIGGIDAPVVFSGLAPGQVSLYQVDAQVPGNAPVGNAIQLVLTMTGPNGPISSQPVTIAVQ